MSGQKRSAVGNRWTHDSHSKGFYSLNTETATKWNEMKPHILVSTLEWLPGPDKSCVISHGLPALSLSLFLSLHFEAPSLILLFLQFYVCSRKFTCSLGHEWWILCPCFLLFEDHMQKHIDLKFRRWLQISLLIRRDDGWVWHTDTTLFSSSFYRRERMVFIKRGCVWNRLYRAVSFIIIYEFYCTF